MEPPASEIWRERQNATSEEGLSVTGRFASNEQRAKPAVRKHSGGAGVGQQCVIAGTQLWLTDDIEGPLQRRALAAGSAARFKLQVAQFECYA